MPEPGQPATRTTTPRASCDAMSLALACAFDASACAIDYRGKPAPTVGQPAQVSTAAAIVHAGHNVVQPDAAEAERFTPPMRDLPMDVIVHPPSRQVDASTVRLLKGKLPSQPALRIGLTGCDVTLVPNHQYVHQYVVFANPSPDVGALIVPMRGRFDLGGSGGSALLADVESSLSSFQTTRP